MLRKQEKFHPAEISCKNIGENSLVEPCGITVNRSKFQERPCDFVDDVHNLYVPADDYPRLEQDGLVERCLGEQFNLCVGIIRRKATCPLPRMKLVLDVRPVRMYGKADV